MDRILISPDDIEGIELSADGHISTGGSSIYSQIISGVIAGKQLVIFRPCMGKLDKLSEEQQSIFSPQQLLDLVDREMITIAGREQWFDKKYRQNDRIWGRNYPWTKFDDALVEKLEEDSKASKPFEKRRVICLPEAEGKTYSEEILDTQPELVEHAKELLNARKLPKGLLERALKPDTVEKGEREQIRVIIQDARNNCNLLKESGSDIPFRPQGNFDDVDLLAQRPLTKISGDINREFKFADLIYILSSLRRFRRYDEFLGFLQRKDRAIVVEGIQEFLRRENLIQSLQEDISSASRNQHRKRSLIKLDGAAIQSFLAALFGYALGGVTGVGLGIAITNLINIKSLLQKVGMAKLDTPGLEWVSMYVFASRGMQEAQLAELRRMSDSLDPNYRKAFEEGLGRNAW